MIEWHARRVDLLGRNPLISDRFEFDACHRQLRTEFIHCRKMFAEDACDALF